MKHRCEEKTSTLIGAPNGRGGYQRGLDGRVKQYKRTYRCKNQATVLWHLVGRPDVYYCDEHKPRENRRGHLRGFKGSWLEEIS